MVRKILPMLLVLIGLSLVGCGEYGKVEQGRTVGFDTTKKPPVVWIIKDDGLIEGKPQYTVLPAHPFELPALESETGAATAVGKRINLNVEGKIITMYNEKTQQFDKLPFEVVKDDMNVSVRAKHPLVWDDATGKARKFPVINEEEKQITIYSRRQNRLTTIKLAPADFAKYSGEDWDAGDEVRIYYKQPGKALRFMNITKTDFSRRK
jgi:hypothetical protein